MGWHPDAAKRNFWPFNYKAGDLVVPAQKKATYHRERQKNWLDSYERVKRELKEKGIDIRFAEVTGGERADIVVDQQIQRRLDECMSKMRAHKRQAEEYEAFTRAFTLNEHQELELTVDDINYFGL